jgi:uncharacterized protein with FMN-binding domain
MTRIAFWMAGTVTALVLLFTYNTSTAGSIGAAQGPAKGQTGTPSGKVDPSKGPVTKVDGKPIGTRWGPVQVELAYQHGKIVAVTVLQQPHGNAMDTFIGNRSIPKLIAETLRSQSAHIATVTGATFTSGGYLTSLQSALDMKGA